MPPKYHSCSLPKTKVSLISRHFNRLGGLEKYTRKTAEAFASRGIKVNILTLDRVKQDHFHPFVSFHTLPLKKGFKFQKVLEFSKACQKWQCNHRSDIIFGLDVTAHQTHIRAGNGMHAAYLRQKQLLETHFHPLIAACNPKHRAILNIEKRALESPQLKKLFTNSFMVKKEAMHFYNIPSQKIEVIHNGVEWEEMKEDFISWIEKKQSLLKPFGLNPLDYHFLFIGNGYKRKGLTYLLHALKTLAFKDVHLLVVGKEKNIPYYKKLAQKLGIERQVTFFGPCSNIREFYQVADSLVIPSIYDPFANVTVEALAMGLYVVSSPYNGGMEVLKEGNGTVISDLKNPKSFAKALSKAFMHPKTWVRSQNIRESIKYLNFSNQLSTLLDSTLQP